MKASHAGSGVSERESPDLALQLPSMNPQTCLPVYMCLCRVCIVSSLPASVRPSVFCALL